MGLTDWIGFLGVFQILLAYFLNVIGKVSNKSLSFILLNVIGAAMACFASILLRYWPFIILEGVWTLVSIYALLKLKKIS
jgi:isoprenylcysteine carboxyl methyltransferase (ICMT) family protein YpbQ